MLPNFPHNLLRKPSINISTVLRSQMLDNCESYFALCYKNWRIHQIRLNP